MIYSILIYGVPGLFDRLPEAEQQKALAAHSELQEKLKAEGTYRGSVRLMPPSAAMTVREQGNSVVVTDGPFAETKEQLLGFYNLEVETIEEALEAAKMLPQGIAHMEVRPVAWSESGD